MTFLLLSAVTFLGGVVASDDMMIIILLCTHLYIIAAFSSKYTPYYPIITLLLYQRTNV